jgi:GNAT superfamily N-acetyltransferase
VWTSRPTRRSTGRCLSELAITELTPADAAAVRRLIDGDAPDYRRFFLALDGEVVEIAAVLGAARLDRYWGIRVRGELAAVVMLRGLDQGYRTPAFGVYVARAASGKGLGQLALQFAIAWCRVAGLTELMLTVDAEHVAAVHVYEKNGFVFCGELSQRGHRVYRKLL